MAGSIPSLPYTDEQLYSNLLSMLQINFFPMKNNNDAISTPGPRLVFRLDLIEEPAFWENFSLLLIRYLSRSRVRYLGRAIVGEIVGGKSTTALLFMVNPEGISGMQLDVVVLEGDGGWTQEEFESQIVKEREGKRLPLTGDLQVTLKEGARTLGELTFTDNSSWIRSRTFRLGLRVASGFVGEFVYKKKQRQKLSPLKIIEGNVCRNQTEPIELILTIRFLFIILVLALRYGS
ncbi:hypothetical protein LguiB_010595 [Lonicera macranthoides]